MLKPRLVFVLLADRGTFVLSRNFRLQAVGDLRWLRSHYDFAAIAHSIDELVVLDVERSPRKDLTRFTLLLGELAASCFVPIAAGGGLRSLDDAFQLLGAGADKLVVNTPLVDDPALVRSLVTTFGAQSVVASLDYKHVGARREVFVADGARATGLELTEAARRAEELGVGELLVTSMDRDGTGQGYDLEGVRAVASAVSVPVVACGGVGRFDHLAEGLERGGASAVATANLFNFMADGLVEARAQLRARGVPLAAWEPGWQTGREALVVTARMRSTRLPEKMLADVEGRPALAVLLARLEAARLPGLRLLCTSDAPEDDRLEQLGRSLGWRVFRGDEEDVLRRYLEAAVHHGLELLVNVDGDDLFCSAAHVDSIIERYRATRADYIGCEGLPFGGAPIGLRCAALREVCTRKGETKTQGWGKYFVESGLFKVERIQAEPALRRPGYRLTLDYPEDLELFRAVVRALGPARLDLPSIVAHLDAHPEVRAINEHMSDEYWARFRREHGGFTLRADPPG